MAEDPRRIRYREAVNRLKTLRPGTEAYIKNADMIQALGSGLGLRWQDDLPKGYKPPTPIAPFGGNPGPQPAAQPTPAPTTPAPYTPPDKIERDAAQTKYKEAVNRIKGLGNGSPEWSKNAEIIRSLGSKFGWNWQNDLPNGYSGPAQTTPTGQPPAAGPTDGSPQGGAPGTPAGQPPAGFQYGYAPGDEVIVRKALSNVNMSPDEARRFQQIAYYDLIPNAGTAAERRSLMSRGKAYMAQFGQAEGVPDSNGWHKAGINNASLLPPEFDAEAYIKNNPDLAAAGVDPVQHFLDNGIFENRIFTKDGKRTGEFFDADGVYKAPVKPEEKPPEAAQPPASPLDKALLDKAVKNLFPSQDPQFYEGSALYNFQRDKGLGSLDRLMASRGLTGSGAEIQANSDFLNQLGAEESERARDYQAKKDALASSASQFVLGLNSQDQQKALDQLLTARGQDQGFMSNLLGIGLDTQRLNSQNEQQNADRAVNVADMTARNNLQASANALNGYVNYINSGFSQSPLDAALDAASGIGKNQIGYGQDSAKITQNLYSRPTAYAHTGGGGGGGGYSPVQYAPYMPPSSRPSGPNFSVPNMIGIFGGAANNAGYINAGNSFLGGMFGGGGKSSGSLW